VPQIYVTNLSSVYRSEFRNSRNMELGRFCAHNRYRNSSVNQSVRVPFVKFAITSTILISILIFISSLCHSTFDVEPPIVQGSAYKTFFGPRRQFVFDFWNRWIVQLKITYTIQTNVLIIALNFLGCWDFIGFGWVFLGRHNG